LTWAFGKIGAMLMFEKYKHIFTASLFCLIVSLILVLDSQVFAQESDSLSEIDIRGTVRREELLTTSATILTNKDIVDRVYFNPNDMLNLVPGVRVGFYGEGGLAADVYIRGFTGGHSGGGVGMYLDGIPLHDNSGHDRGGYIDSNMIMPIEIESVEVIKGPASVYYGRNASGGSIPFQSIKRGNHTKLNIRYGSDNNQMITGLLGRDVNEKFSHIYAFEIYHTNGYRDHSDQDKTNFSARWTYTPTDKLSLSLNVRAYQQEWNSAGYISYRTRPRYGAVDDGSGEWNGGDRKRYDARIWANYLIDKSSQLTWYIYGTDYDSHRAMRSDRTLNLNGTFSGGTGSWRYNKHRAWGTGLSYTYDGVLFGKEAQAAMGLSYSYEKDGPYQQWSGIPWGYGRNIAFATSYTHRSNDVKNPAFFGEISYQILDQIKVRVGARYDTLHGTFINYVTKKQYKSPIYTFFAPKFGILYTPIDNLQIYANYGRGYQIPQFNTTDASTESFYQHGEFGLTVQNQFEIGARAQPLDWLNLEFAYFLINTDKDTTYNAELDTNEAAGKTRRQGIELSFLMNPVDPPLLEHWHLSGFYTFTDAKYKKYEDQNYNYAGHRLTSVPKHMYRLELSYEPPTGFNGRVSYRGESNVPARDRPGDIRYENNIRYLDLQLGYKFNENYKLVFDVTNVLNEEFNSTTTAYATSNAYDYTYSPRPPRQFYLGLMMNWDKM
jgi:outer membrane receptor protein involved in Fe transport